jgi:hypothetical protein
MTALAWIDHPCTSPAYPTLHDTPEPVLIYDLLFPSTPEKIRTHTQSIHRTITVMKTIMTRACTVVNVAIHQEIVGIKNTYNVDVAITMDIKKRTVSPTRIMNINIEVAATKTWP